MTTYSPFNKMKVLILLKRLFNNQAYIETVPHMLVVSDISGMRIEKINSH